MENAVQQVASQAAEHGLWVKDLFVFLAAAAVIVPIFHRARIGAVSAFLLVGLVVGPYGLVTLAGEYEFVRLLSIDDKSRVEPFAELGVMFLLFFIGLELSFRRLWSLRRYVFGVGSAQFSGCGAAIAVIAYLSGAPGLAAAILGLSLAMSSTAIVLQLLEEQGRLATTTGQVALSVLLFQDLMVAPILFGVEFLGREDGGLASGLGGAVAGAVAAIVLIMIAGRFVLRPFFRFVAATGSRELIMALAVLTVIVIAGATGAAGLSTALGAFLAGLLLSETEYRHQIEIDLEPFKGLLLGLFFVTVGMSIDLAAVASQALIIAAGVALLVGIKSLITLAATRAFGIPLGPGAESAMLLAQAGEFGFVVIALSSSRGLLSPEIAQVAAAIVGLSMVLTPLGAVAATRVGRRLHELDLHHAGPKNDDGDLADHVVIGGYGRVGQIIARLLEAENVPVLAIDSDAEIVNANRGQAMRIFFGDAGRAEMLARAGAKNARAFVVTVNATLAAERMVVAARGQNPAAPVFARAKDGRHAARLRELGAVDLVPEVLEAALQLGGRVLEGLGLTDEAVERRLEEARARELRRLRP